MTAISNKQNFLDKAQLQFINRRFLGYGLGDAEKDYFLARVSKLIFE